MSLLPGDAPPLTDPGNHLLAAGLPCTMQTGLTGESAGRQVGIITIRTPDVTLSLTVSSRSEVDDLITMLTQLRDQMSSTGLVTGVAHDQVAALRRPGG